MSKHTLIAILGILVSLNSYLGFSQSIKTFIFILSGILITLLSYLSSRDRSSKTEKSDVFEENNNDSFPDSPPLNSDQNSLLKE